MKQYFLTLLEKYLDFLLNVKNYSKKTVLTYQKPIQDALDLSELYEDNNTTIFDLTKYRLSIATQSKNTINKKLSSIRSFVTYLNDNGNNIVVKSGDSVKSLQLLPKPIETEHILEAIAQADIEEKLILSMIYTLGVRISELTNLTLNNISKNYIIVLGKGNKQRQIPLIESIWELIESYKQLHNPKVYLFEKEEKHLSSRQLQYRLQKCFEKIGLKVTPHQLRHSFATDLLNNGARINDISLLLGHSSLKATGIYTKLTTNIKLKQYNTSHPLSQIR